MNTLKYPKFEEDGTDRGPRHCVMIEHLEIFFAEADAPNAPESKQLTYQAKGVCAECPYRIECAAYAIDHEDERGVWGGLSEDDRRQIRRKMTKATTKAS